MVASALQQLEQSIQSRLGQSLQTQLQNQQKTVITETNLVSDGFVPALTIDPNLINPWGVSSSPTGPFWVSDNGAGVITIYSGAGTPTMIGGKSAIEVAPPGQTTSASPTVPASAMATAATSTMAAMLPIAPTQTTPTTATGSAASMAGATTSTTPAMMTSSAPGQTTSTSATGSGASMAGATTSTTPAMMTSATSGQTTPASPTGQVFNAAGSGFDISSGGVTAPSVFIFATEDGTISGWNPTVNGGSTVLAVDNSDGGNGAVYKGLTMAQTANGPMLYAANFRNGTVDVFNSNFQQVNSFTDPKVPAGFAPFNVQVLDNHLFVTFAKQDSAKHDDVAGLGNGFVDEFDLNGKLEQRVASGGPLDSPWGLAIAPSGFGQFANDLLVGNFGNGTINAYDPKTDKFAGQLLDANGSPITIGDLWTLTPGNGGASDPQKIYFTSGVQNEADGLFGSLTATPESNQSAQSTPGSQPNTTTPTPTPGVINEIAGQLNSLIAGLGPNPKIQSVLKSIVSLLRSEVTSATSAAMSGSQSSTSGSSSPMTAMTATQPTTAMAMMSSSQPSTTSSSSPMTAMIATQPTTAMTTMSASQPLTVTSSNPVTVMTATQPTTAMTTTPAMTGSQSSILGSSNPMVQTTPMSSASGSLSSHTLG